MVARLIGTSPPTATTGSSRRLIEFEESLLAGPGADQAPHHVPADGPGLAAHDGAALGHDDPGRAHRHDPARPRRAAVAALLCRPGPAGEGRPAARRPPVRSGGHRAHRRRFRGGRRRGAGARGRGAGRHRGRAAGARPDASQPRARNGRRPRPRSGGDGDRTPRPRRQGRRPARRPRTRDRAGCSRPCSTRPAPPRKALPRDPGLGLPPAARTLVEGLAARVARGAGGAARPPAHRRPGRVPRPRVPYAASASPPSRAACGASSAVAGATASTRPAAAGIRPPASPSTWTSILRALPRPDRPSYVFLPAGAPVAEARRLQAEGWRTRAGLGPAPDAAAEARRLGCSHLYVSGAVTALG